MNLINLSFAGVLSSIIAAADDATDDVHACNFYNTLTVNGFDAMLYQYEARDNTDYSGASYMAYEYSENKVVASTAGIFEPYTNLFAVTNEDNEPVNGQIYGYDITSSNFTAEFKSYFKADKSGYYTF